ncbi:MAG: hypothetical protein EBR94_01185 [Bacteroidetes bacterium]|nr:hypothetical protein [Bacteroidota bacterium]
MSLELKKIPSKIYTPLREDTNPDSENLVGKRIVWISGNTNLFGRVVRVYNKHVLIALEKKWMKRIRWTVNWTHLYLVDEQDTEKIEKEKINRENEKNTRMKELHEHMKKIVKFHEVSIYSTVKNTNEQQSVAENLVKEYTLFKEYLEEFFLLKTSLISMHANMKKIYDKCIEMGIKKEHIPDIPSSAELLFDAKKNSFSKKENKEKKKNLASIRSATRFVLTNLLIAAGEEGLSSEDIISAITKTFEENTEAKPDAITSHRIMGMLSSLSRRKEAENIDGKKWKATEKLQSQQIPFLLYND